MLKIAIYSNRFSDINDLKEIVYEYLTENKIVAKVSTFEDSYELLTASNSYDIYIMDMDMHSNVAEIGRQISVIDTGTKFIYVSENTALAYDAFESEADYFLAKPFNKDKVLKILKEIRQHIQDENIVIKTAIGEKRVRANALNYINIVQRCLCYHLTDGTMFDGQALRTSFEKAISPLQYHRSNTFLFLPPSLLINVGEIKILDTDKVIFENNDILYISKKQHDLIDSAWKSYNRFINIE